MFIGSRKRTFGIYGRYTAETAHFAKSSRLASPISMLEEHLAERPERVPLDFRRVTNSYELQQILKDGLFSQIFTE